VQFSSPTDLATQTSQGAQSTTSQGVRSTTSSVGTVVVDILEESVTKGLEKLLPDLLPEMLSKLLPPILTDMLPDLLRAALPNLLAATSSLSPSQSPSSTPVKPMKLNAILSGCVKTHLQSIFARAVDAAAEAAAESASNLADIELAETLDEHRTDILYIRQEAEIDIARIAHEQVDAFRDAIDGIAEDVGNDVERHAGEAVSKACDLLDEVVGARWVGEELSQRIEESQADLVSQIWRPG
jgi:hypothetical protein